MYLRATRHFLRFARRCISGCCLATGERSIGPIRRVRRDIYSELGNRGVDRVLRNVCDPLVPFAREEIRRRVEPGCPATGEAHLELLPRGSPAHDRAVPAHPARGRGDKMLAIGSDEDRIGVPAAKNPLQPSRRREEQTIRGKRNDLERLRDGRVAGLARIAAGRYGQMHVAVRRHQERHLRAALGDPAPRSREEPRGARPFASGVKKQYVHAFLTLLREPSGWARMMPGFRHLHSHRRTAMYRAGSTRPASPTARRAFPAPRSHHDRERVSDPRA